MKTILVVLLVCSSLLSATLSQSTLADIYQWTDENGKVHFSDKPPRDRQVTNISHTTTHINV